MPRGQSEGANMRASQTVGSLERGEKKENFAAKSSKAQPGLLTEQRTEPIAEES